MKYIKLFENFEEIESICYKYGIKNYTIHPDRTVDVDGHVNLTDQRLFKLPLKFGKVNGCFDCSGNNLIYLNGCPEKVWGDFRCYYNKLITLVGGPRIVRYEYHCHTNKLVDVHGFPEYFDQAVYMRDNPVWEIISLVPGALDNPWKNEQEIKFIKYLNEYDAIREGNKIVEMRLEEAYWMATKIELLMDRRMFKNYTLI